MPILVALWYSTHWPCAHVCRPCCGAVYADGLREAWRNVVDVILHLHGIGVLPDDVVDVDDFRAPNGNRLPSLGVGLRNKRDPRLDGESCFRQVASLSLMTDCMTTRQRFTGCAVAIVCNRQRFAGCAVAIVCYRQRFAGCAVAIVCYWRAFVTVCIAVGLVPSRC